MLGVCCPSSAFFPFLAGYLSCPGVSLTQPVWVWDNMAVLEAPPSQEEVG